MNKKSKTIKIIILELEQLLEEVEYGGDKIENIEKVIELLKQVYIYGDTA